jgi:hypothetical protein
MNPSGPRSPTLAYFLDRLNALEEYVDDWNTPNSDAKEDAEALVEEMLITAASAVDFKDLARRIEARRSVDLDALSKIPEILTQVALPDVVVTSPNLTVEAPQLIAKIRHDIESMQQDIKKIGSLDIAIRLDHNIGRAVRRVLLAAAKNGTPVPALVALVKQKLDLLDESQLSILWASAQREFDSPSLAPMIGPDGLAPKEWLTYDTPESVRQKLAEYVVQLRYQMMYTMAALGIDGFPKNLPEVARIVSWRSSAASERLNEQEGALHQTIARIAELINKLFGRENADMALALGVDSDSVLLRRDKRMFGDESPKSPPLRSICYELRKLMHLTELFLSKEGPIEKALRQYKLGLEILAPDIIGETEGKKELRLQRELAKFLVERGIFAAGTQFGRSETDLVATERSNHYILEVKKFTRKQGLSERRLKASLVQLQCYLDHHPSTPFGVLVIYNFTDTVLLVPQQWIRGRFWILAINLQVNPPSGRKSSLTVEAGETSETIAVHLVTT